MAKTRLGRHVAVLVALFLTASIFLHGKSTLYLDVSTLTPFHTWVNSISDWISLNRDSNPFFLFFINILRSAINWIVNGSQNLLSQGFGQRQTPILNPMLAVRAIHWCQILSFVNKFQ